MAVEHDWAFGDKHRVHHGEEGDVGSQIAPGRKGGLLSWNRIYNQSRDMSRDPIYLLNLLYLP